MSRSFIFLFFFGTLGTLSAQDSLMDFEPTGFEGRFLDQLEGKLNSFYSGQDEFRAGFDPNNEFAYAKDSVPVFSDSVYASRLEVLNRKTPINFRYNRSVKTFINLYAVRKKDLTSRVLGLKELYFPLYEEMMDHYGIPLELRNLSIIESALNPVAQSPVGARGLWQFMYGTGKMYGLQVNSFVDERCDPYKSTEAACKYLKFLHGMYDDWLLALAAYNAGPGNINKAIRRSGGRKNYWEVRPYMPRETRNYVPAFIAVNYIMEYAPEHNIYPSEPMMRHFQCDTVGVCRPMTFDQLAKELPVTQEELKFLNPAYRHGFIPVEKEAMVLKMPRESVGLFVEKADSIYQRMETEEVKRKLDEAKKRERERILHRVRSGESLSVIARKYGVNVSDLKAWNRMRGTFIRVGQQLVVYPHARGYRAGYSKLNPNKA